MKTENKNSVENQVTINDLRAFILNKWFDKGLNGVYAFLKRNGINYTKNVVEFGISTNKGAIADFKKWESEKTNSNVFRFRYGTDTRIDTHTYLIKGIEIELNWDDVAAYLNKVAQRQAEIEDNWK